MAELPWNYPCLRTTASTSLALDARGLHVDLISLKSRDKRPTPTGYTPTYWRHMVDKDIAGCRVIGVKTDGYGECGRGVHVDEMCIGVWFSDPRSLTRVTVMEI
jgi:hypothetical protein